MNLPIEFKEKMNKLLGEEAQDFFDSFSLAEQKSIWLNTSVISKKDFEALADFEISPIPHIPGGYYYCADKIGQTPFHHCGAIYSQDPAAMLPALLLPIQPDWKVLDLCAAPGGKSTQLATFLSRGSGQLLSNEIHPGRNKILVENMQRMGFSNLLVTKLSPQDIASSYPGFFDLVLVDAPCSGEGMFRKYSESTKEWSPAQVLLCRERQKEILSFAQECVKPGGYLIYSTCTYSPEENEEILQWLIEEFPFSLLPAKEEFRDITSSHPDYPELSQGARRCYPHKYRGEGQFMVCLHKENPNCSKIATYTAKQSAPLTPAKKTTLNLIKDSMKNSIDIERYDFYEHKEKVLILPKEHIPLPPHGISQCGTIAGTLENKRFTPHHHWFKVYGRDFNNRYEITDSENSVYDYLKGLELYSSFVANGYGVITYHGVPLGGFKASGGRMKNHYPKALRNHL